MDYFAVFLLLFVAFDLVFIGFVLWKRRHSGIPNSDKMYVLKHWERIEGTFQDDPRHAVMEADKLVHYLLKKRFSVNLSFGDFLKQHSDQFTDINSLWAAHKLRNSLAHEINAQFSKDELGKAIKYFALALNDLGVKV